MDQKFSLPLYDIAISDRRLSNLQYLIDSLSGIDQPILRGARRETYRIPQGLLDFMYAEVHCNGLIELGFLSAAELYKQSLLDPDMILGLFAHLLKWVEKVRDNTVSSKSEYLIDLECRVRDMTIRLGYNRRTINVRDAQINLTDTSFPTYTFDVDSDVVQLMNQFRRDLFNWVGWDMGDQDVSVSFKNLRN